MCIHTIFAGETARCCSHPCSECKKGIISLQCFKSAGFQWLIPGLSNISFNIGCNRTSLFLQCFVFRIQLLDWTILNLNNWQIYALPSRKYTLCKIAMFLLTKIPSIRHFWWNISWIFSHALIFCFLWTSLLLFMDNIVWNRSHKDNNTLHSSLEKFLERDREFLVSILRFD